MVWATEDVSAFWGVGSDFLALVGCGGRSGATSPSSVHWLYLLSSTGGGAGDLLLRRGDPNRLLVLLLWLVEVMNPCSFMSTPIRQTTN